MSSLYIYIIGLIKSLKILFSQGFYKDIKAKIDMTQQYSYYILYFRHVGLLRKSTKIGMFEWEEITTGNCANNLNLTIQPTNIR